MTRLARGKDAVDEALRTAESLFEGSSGGYTVKSISNNRPTLETALPVFDLEKRDYKIIELLTLSNLATSNSEARRLIAGKAIKIENKTIDSDAYVVDSKTSIVMVF